MTFKIINAVLAIVAGIGVTLALFWLFNWREPVDDLRAKIDDLLPGETRSMIHATARSSSIECGNPILSKNGPSPC